MPRKTLLGGLRGCIISTTIPVSTRLFVLSITIPASVGIRREVVAAGGCVETPSVPIAPQEMTFGQLLR